MLAYDFPLLGSLLAIGFFFLWVIWIILLLRTVLDIFRSEDLSGPVKFAWLLFVVVLPYLGVFVYVISRGADMHRRDTDRMKASEDAFRDYVQSVSGGSSAATELAKLAELREKGVLTDAEFEQQKARLLA